MWVLPTVLLCVFVVAGGCREGEAPVAKSTVAIKKTGRQGTPASAFEKFLADINSTEKQWYGVYMQGHKIGYANMELFDRRRSVPPAVESSMTMLVEVKAEDKVIRMRMTSRELFDVDPPYRLRSFVEETMQQDEIERIEITRILNGTNYSARITQGGSTRIRKFSADYTIFKSELLLDLWFQSSRAVGDEVEYPSLDTSSFRITTDKARIKAKKTGMFNGVQTTYYVVDMTVGDGDIHAEVLLLSDGTVIKATVGGFFELRLEPEKIAKTIDASRDLFVDNLVPAEGKIGDPTEIKRMVIDVDSQLGEALGNAPGQRVVAQPASKTYRVTVTTDNSTDVRVTENEKERALKATLEFPADVLKVIDLAKKAVGNAKSQREKVNRLVHFVDKYIVDSYSAEPLTVMDTVKRRKGDCSEHSALFTTLARALGIPTRTVGGLIYGDDDELGTPLFGMHAWNEVALDGFWVPVDSTWNETTINATHIRFPIKINKEMQVVSSLPKARIKVVEVNAANKKAKKE
jgi:hypothetical protein